MANKQDEAVLAELKDSLAKARGEDSKKDLFNEDISAFDTKSMTFPEITAEIFEQTEDLFWVTRACDRFAPEYLQFCKDLVSAVDHLGAAFITKCAFCAWEYPVTGLEALSAERLMEMISFNFRKCSAALNELKKKNDVNALEHFRMLLSFTRTAQRLRATHCRGYELTSHRADPQSEYNRGHAFIEKDICRRDLAKYITDQPFRSSPSYAIRMDALEEAAQLAKNSAEESAPDHAESCAPAQPEPAEESVLPEGSQDGPKDGSPAVILYSSDEEPPYSEDEDDDQDFDTTGYPFLEMALRAKRRGKALHPGLPKNRPVYAFRYEEMKQAINDPDFLFFFRGLVPEIRKLLAETDTG